MKKVLILFTVIIFLFMQNIKAEDAKDGKKTGWTSKGVVGLNFSQVSLSNWAKGGDNTLAWTLIGTFGAKYTGVKWDFHSSLKASYGRTKLGSEDSKTSDNELFWDQILIYNTKWLVNPYFSNTVRTALGKGFDYEKTPWEQISDFWDPGYLNQGLGFSYGRAKNWEFRLGLGFKETWAKDFAPKYTDDAATPEIEKFKFETGIDLAGSGQWQFAENILFQSKLNMFGKFENLAIWDVRWDNTLTAKFSDFFNVNLNVLLVYDQDESYKTQVKEALQIGITYTLF